MRISDWSSDVCSSDLWSPTTAARRSASPTRSCSCIAARWPSAALPMPSSAGRLQPRPRPTWKAGCCCEPSPKREIAMLRRSFLALAAATTAGLAFAGATAPAAAQDKFIIVQSTTSTQNSGLFDYMLPLFTEKTGIEVRVVAVGTGQAIKNAQNCDGDVLFVHAKAAEETFVAEGYGVSRADVMYNDFVIVGPAADPAGAAGSRSEEHTSELQSLMRISYAVFCLKKKKHTQTSTK